MLLHSHSLINPRGITVPFTGNSIFPEDKRTQCMQHPNPFHLTSPHLTSSQLTPHRIQPTTPHYTRTQHIFRMSTSPPSRLPLLYIALSIPSKPHPSLNPLTTLNFSLLLLLLLLPLPYSRHSLHSHIHPTHYRPPTPNPETDPNPQPQPYLETHPPRPLHHPQRHR